MIDIKNRKIALVGGAGFIGHHLAIELKRKGANVEIIDSLQVNNLLKFAVRTGDKNRDLYYHFINERLNLLRSANIPVHSKISESEVSFISDSLRTAIEGQANSI